MRDAPGWTEKDLGDLCSLLNGLAFKPEDWSANGTPIIRIQNLNGSGDFNLFDGVVADEYLIPPKTLLFSWSGNRGTSFGPYRWGGPRGILNQHIFKVSPKEGTDTAWLFYALDIARERAEREAHGGSGLVHVRRGDLLGYRVPVPPHPEQRRIAEILDTLDDLILKTEQLIAKLKQVKKGLLHDLLTRGIDENGELRDPERHPERFKDSPLGGIPKAWEAPPLEELATAPICYGIVQAGPFVADGVPVLMIRNLLGDFATGLHQTARHIDQSYARSRVEPGDLLLSIKGTIGRTGVVPAHYAGNISRDLARLRIGTQQARFMHHFFQSPMGQRRLELSVVGTTRAEISIHVLRRFRVPQPSPNEQAEVVRRLDAQDIAIRSSEAELSKLAATKSGLMEDLLTGRVRVNGLEDAA